MPWWSWVVTGALLFAAEMFGINAQFYLVFVGTAAIVVGLIGSLGMIMPEWAQWLSFAALALLLMIGFRERLYRRFRETNEFVEERLQLGARILIPERLAPEASCRVDYKGTSWTARNVDREPIEAGVEAEICETVGFILHVRNRVTTPNT